MKQAKTPMHFVDNNLLQPANPVMVNLIGAGGTGSQVLTALARINHSLLALHHAGLFVRVFDDDEVTAANLGRQLFAGAELGMKKAVALVSRINRFFGTNWKAVPEKYNSHTAAGSYASITISCVDSVAARFEIASILRGCPVEDDEISQPKYWMDFGNSRNAGQVILSTVSRVKQPVSKKFATVSYLPFITDEFKGLLQSINEDDTPSCSLAEALTRQDLFINTSLAALGASLLWTMFSEGMVEHRGFFLNLKDFRTQPLKLAQEMCSTVLE